MLKKKRHEHVLPDTMVPVESSADETEKSVRVIRRRSCRSSRARCSIFRFTRRHLPTFLFLVEGLSSFFYRRKLKKTLRPMGFRRMSFIGYSKFRVVPSRFLFKRFSVFVAFLFVFGSLNFGEAHSLHEGHFLDFPFSVEESGFLVDEEGYFTKAVPAETGDGDWVGIAGVHTVQPGETVSQVASSYGLKNSTLIWENNLEEPFYLRVGQKLAIPPEDGVSHPVKEGESIEKIAEKYKIDSKLIAQANNIVDGVIQKNVKIFIPGGKKLVEQEVKPRAIAFARDSSSNRASKNVGTISKVNVVPSVGKKLIFPTKGEITQRYHSGHYAVDIANRSKPPIWAAAGGKVIKAGGGWNGGYGNYVIIDHGDGFQTLYGHMAEYYVEVGQTVSQGQVIGKMGNTGRVYGVTGIHVHFEVRQDGVKKNPANYY